MTEQEILRTLELLKAKRVKIIELQERIKAEAAIKDGLTGIAYSSPKLSGGTFITPQERYCERIEHLQGVYNRIYSEYEKMANPILDRMKRLQPTQWQVLINRFFRGMSVKRTAEVMCFSAYNVSIEQKEAVKKLSEFKY